MDNAPHPWNNRGQNDVQSINQSINQSISQSINQSTNQSINISQSINKSINWSMSQLTVSAYNFVCSSFARFSVWFYHRKLRKLHSFITILNTLLIVPTTIQEHRLSSRLTPLSLAISLLSAFLEASLVISFTREAYLNKPKKQYKLNFMTRMDSTISLL